jgi:hypothetical protein
MGGGAHAGLTGAVPQATGALREVSGGSHCSWAASVSLTWTGEAEDIEMPGTMV